MKDKRGRKKIDTNLKKIAIQIYIEKYKIDEIGGKDKAKDFLINYIQNFKEEIIKAFESGQQESAIGIIQKKGEQYYNDNYDKKNR